MSGTSGLDEATTGGERRQPVRRALVLSSGGVDSTTCLAMAVRDFGVENTIAVSVFYGQRHRKEIECSVAVSEYYGVEHRTLDLSEILRDSSCALLADAPTPVPHGAYAAQVREQIDETGDGIVETYVPFRNGLMLSAVAALAMSLHPHDQTTVYLGAHADDAAGDVYPDCSPEFIGAIARAINLGTYGKVELAAPFAGMTKAQVVATGLALDVPYELTWSCYEGGEVPCGECATCIDRIAAFRANGTEDPLMRGVAQ